MTDTWRAAFARKVAEEQAAADAVDAAAAAKGNPRDDTAAFARMIAEFPPDTREWFVGWVHERIGDRAPTRAEAWVLLEVVPTDDEDEDEAYDRILADLDLGHAAEARQQLHAEWSAIDTDFTTAEFFAELVRRGALSSEQAKRELAFIETWTAARARAAGSPDA